MPFQKGQPRPSKAGRKKGVPNKATADIKALAVKHAPAAIKELVRLMTKAESEATRVAAAKELLDRGLGKAAQPIEGDLTVNVVSKQLAEVFSRTDGKRLGQAVRSTNGVAREPGVATRPLVQGH
jgi:hypothetical protein